MPIVHSGRQKGGAQLRSAAACAEAETPAQVGTSPSYSAAWQGFARGHGTTVWNYVEIGADATLDARTECAMLTNADDTLFPFSLPSVGKKKVTAVFDAGQISSDGGVLLLAGADKRLGLIDMLATLIPDHRDPALITHTLSDILRVRVFA